MSMSMSIRIIVFLLACVGTHALAQEPRKERASADQTQRAAMLATMPRGKVIQGEHGSYQHLPEVRAVERSSLNVSPQQAVDRLGLSNVAVIETKGRLVLFRLPQLASAQVERFGEATVYPTVLNLRTSKLGVLTGVLVVKLRDATTSTAIAGSHGLEVMRAFPHIRTVFFRPTSGADVADLAAALQADPRVEKAYPEIIEHVRVPQ